MYITTVIPLTRAKVAQTLSYFTGSDVPVGAIVSVPMRSRTIHAIVIEVRPAEDVKSELRRAPYTIRKLGEVKATLFLPPHVMSVCQNLAEYYAASVGSIIDGLISDTLLDRAHSISPALPRQAALPMNGPKQDTYESLSGTLDDTFAIQGDDEDRWGSWRSVIRQHFARKKSLAFYVPTIEDARTLAEQLQKGIEAYLFVLHSGLTAKRITDTWQDIADATHPVVVIATASFSVLPRGDIDTVIIERENSRGWIGLKHPYLDLRMALEQLARANKQTVFVADTLLRAETLYRVAEHDISEGSPFKWRSISNAKDILVDMRTKPEAGTRDMAHASVPLSTDSVAGQTEPAETEPPITFRVISPELIELIRENQENNSHLFILAIRRGTSPTTVCGHCNTIVTCNTCGRPVVLHTSTTTRRTFFMCHRCGERRSADEVCKNCGSWKLVPLGVGIDKVRSEIKKLFPDQPLWKIDSDTTKNEKDVLEVMSAFRAQPGGILIGTEMALPYVDETIEHIAIASLDSLFALPDFRIEEKIMYTLTRLRSTASRNFLIQTRRAQERVFEFALKGNLSDFAKTNLAERAKFHYPPSAVLIKITCEGKREQITADMAALQHAVAPREIDVFPAFTSTTRGNSLLHGLITVELKAWPDQKLVAILRALPPSVTVKINPESLL